MKTMFSAVAALALLLSLAAPAGALPVVPEDVHRVMRLYLSGDQSPREAAEFFECASDPEQPFTDDTKLAAMEALVAVLASEGQADGAEAALRKMRRVFPDHPACDSAEARILAERGRFGDAAKAMDRAIAGCWKDPERAWLVPGYERWKRTYSLAERPVEAEALAAAALADPSSIRRDFSGAEFCLVGKVSNLAENVDGAPLLGLYGGQPGGAWSVVWIDLPGDDAPRLARLKEGGRAMAFCRSLGVGERECFTMGTLAPSASWAR